MFNLRRVAMLSSAAVASTVFAATPVLVSAQNSLAAGDYDTFSTQAAFSSFAPDFSSGIYVDVETHATTSKPSVGPTSTTQSMTVSVQLFQTDFGSGGCYTLGPGSFNLDAGLAGATLHVMVTGDTPTCGQAEIATPFTLDVTWTRFGPLRTSRGLTRSDCLDYRTEAMRNESYTGANATATMPPFITDPLTAKDSGVLRKIDQPTHVQGSVHESCPEQPGAIAGGAGPPNPGQYRNALSQADLTKFDDNGSVGFDLSETTDVSSPRGGPSVTNHQMQVRFNIFLNGVFGGGCFLLSPFDFSFNGVQSAEVNVKLTDASPTCDGGPAEIPLPQTLHVVWTNTAPVSTFRFVGSFDCLSYHDSGQGTESTDHPDAIATLTPFLTEPVTGSGPETSLTVSAGQAEAGGIKRPECHI
jgi:hypothetical protein